MPKKLNSLVELHTLACFDKYHRMVSSGIALSFNEWKNYAYEDDLVQAFLECLMSLNDKNSPSASYANAHSDYSALFEPYSPTPFAQSLVFPPPFSEGLSASISSGLDSSSKSSS